MVATAPSEDSAPLGRAYGTGTLVAPGHPGLKSWAILGSPYGTGLFSEVPTGPGYSRKSLRDREEAIRSQLLPSGVFKTKRLYPEEASSEAHREVSEIGHHG